MIPVLVHHMGPMTPMCLARAVDRVYLSLRMHWQRSIATYVVGWDMHVSSVRRGGIKNKGGKGEEGHCRGR